MKYKFKVGDLVVWHTSALGDVAEWFGPIGFITEIDEGQTVSTKVMWARGGEYWCDPKSLKLNQIKESSK